MTEIKNPPTITIQDEGVTQSAVISTVNFVGSGVTASTSGSTATVTISSSGGLTIGLALALASGQTNQ
jgi:hypothetical protein